jgi:hypothetical protein
MGKREREGEREREREREAERERAIFRNPTRMAHMNIKTNNRKIISE